MKLTATLFMTIVVLLPTLSDARCRTVGESASIGTEYGTFPVYPAKRIVEAGEKRDSVTLQWLGYSVGLPLFVVAMPFAMVGAGLGAHCIRGQNAISAKMIGPASSNGPAILSTAVWRSGVTPTLGEVRNMETEPHSLDTYWHSHL